MAAALANKPAPEGATSAVAHVSLSTVAEAAGVARSTLYQLWPSQQEFSNELLAFAITADDNPTDGSQPVDQADDDLVEVQTGAVYDAVQTLLLTERMALLEIALVGHPAPSHSRRLVAGRRTERVARLSAQLARELDTAGIHCVDGIDVDDLAVALTVIGNGLQITARLSRPAHMTFDSAAYSATRPAAGRSLLGALQVAVRAGLTEHRAEGRPQPVHSPRPPPQGPTPMRIEPTGRRREYLRIAATLASSPGSSDPGVDRALRYVTLDRLARSLGVSRRTLGNVWPDQTSFRLDLLSYLLRVQRRDVIEAIDATTHARSITDEGCAATAFCDLGDRIQEALNGRQNEVSFAVFAPHLDDVVVSEHVRREHGRIQRRVRHALDRLLRNVGRRPRPGVTPDHVAAALLVVCDGANRLLRTDPSLLSPMASPAPRRRSIIGLTVASVLMDITQPVDVRPQVARYAQLLS